MAAQQASSGMAKEITTNLKSARTASTFTFEALQSLLGCRLDNCEKKDKASVSKHDDTKTRSTKAVHKAPVKNLTSSRAQAKATLQIYEGADCHLKPLNSDARRRLATDAFNVALKCLGDAVKARQEYPPTSPACKVIPTTTTKQCQKTKTKPLQTSSPNKQSQLPPRDGREPTLSGDIDVVADCAMVALGYLSSLVELEEDRHDNVSKLEKGALVLLERLVSLGLSGQAFVQASRIYGQYWKRRKNNIHKHAPATDQTSREPNTRLPLVFEATVVLDADFEFVSSFQSQILRLAIANGSQCVTDELITDIAISTSGSPADIVLQGTKAGILSNEKAGQRLRTIAQALLKLYARVTSDKQRQSSNSTLELYLLTEALLVKIESWSLLKHQPEPKTEIWTYVAKALKRLATDGESHTGDVVAKVAASIDSARLCLQKHGFNSTTPADIVNMAIDMAEKSMCYSDGLKLLRQCTSSSRDWSREEQAYFQWRLATLQYKCFSSKGCGLLTTLREAAKTFKEFKCSDIEHINDMLLYGARLRKVVVSVLRDRKEANLDLNTANAHDDLSKPCLSILADMLSVLFGLLQGLGAKDSLDTWKMAYNSFAKTCEALLEFCQADLQRVPWLREQVDERLRHCVGLAKSALSMAVLIQADNPTSAYIEQLLTRISDLYWSWYIYHVDADNEHKTAFNFLTMSCGILEDLGPSLQCSASYATKLERLASVRLTIKDATGSCQAFEQVIQHYIRLGVLKEAASIAVSGPSHNVWSVPKTRRGALYRALQSITKLRLTYGIEDPLVTSWIYNVQSATVVEQVLLFEAQMQAGIEHGFTPEQLEICQDHLRTLLHLCDQPDLRVFRLRSLSNFLQMASKVNSLADVVVCTPDLVERLEGTAQLEKNELLSPYGISLRLLVKLQFWMQPRQFDLDRIQNCSKLLSSFVLGLKDTEALRSSVDDPNFLANQLQAVTDLGRMLDDTELMLSSLSALKHLLTLADSQDVTRRVDLLTQLAVLNHRLGSMVRAGKDFAGAEMLLDKLPGGSTSLSRWALSYAEYLADVSDVDKARDVFCRSGATPRVDRVDQEWSGRQRRDRRLLLVIAAQTAHRLALFTGALDSATRFARQSVRLSSDIWLSMERSNHDVEAPQATGNDSSLHSLAIDMSGLAISLPHQLTTKTLKGSAYWQVAHIHCTSLKDAALLAMHNGLYQDALFYAEQLRKVADSTGSMVRLYGAVAMLALVKAKAGHKDEAVELLQVSDHLRIVPRCVQHRQALILRAEAFIEVGNHAEAKAVLDTLDKHVTAQQLPDSSETKTGIKKAAVRGRTKAVKSIKTPAKRPGRPATEKTPKVIPKDETLRMCRSSCLMYDKCQALRDLISLAQGCIPDATLQPVQAIPQLTSSTPESSLTGALLMLSRAMSELSSDAVKCVLAETAVALPVRYKSHRKSGRVSFVQAIDQATAFKAPKIGHGRAVTSKALLSRRNLSPAESYVSEAQELLQCLVRGQDPMCSTEVLHLAYRLQSKVGLLSSTMNVPFVLSSAELVYGCLASKDIVQLREQCAIRAERSSRLKAHILEWPDVTHLTNRSSADTLFDCNLDDLSELPDSWSVITISLADNQQELLMSKNVGRRSPFLLRVPLARSEMDIDKENEFSYADAKMELLDIVAQANESAHDPRGQADKAARKAWYAERESLDERLEAWLHNIENIWFGGFRGLFCPTSLDDATLSSFGQDLNRALNTHLPSRQKSVANKIALHAHVLELFTGLGHPEQYELEDAVMDLLYFVVDILQFSGERNAYDEIDFDAMLVDVLDALRAYYPLDELPDGGYHTILVVDKELASFPWESLPCLQRQSVTRMPSLSSIVHRLKTVRDQSPAAPGHVVPANQGAYILNPSSDLLSTQNTFQPILTSQLPTYSGMTNAIPTESDFVSMLSDNSLVLYFGHGSGAQYIRGRTIRGLDTCAVTLLMGCSSAKMTECGKFESYGMPGYYIGGNSGCMGVVGTLWDVTDRDIDRFSVRLMLEWGLIGEDEHVQNLFAKGGRSKQSVRGARSEKKQRHEKSPQESKRGKVSLDEAVSKGRDACLLRYLNGAAPVMYGIPVYLE